MRSLRIGIILSLIAIRWTNPAVADMPFRMHAEVGIGEKVDSNIYRRTNTTSDFITEFHPSLRLRFPLSDRTTGNLRYSFGLEQYRSNRFVNTRNHDGFLSIQHEFTNRFSLVLQDNIRKSNLPDALDDQNSLIFNYWQNASRIEGRYRIGVDALVKGSYEYQRRAYTDRRVSRTSDVKQRDRRHNLDATLVRRLGQQTVGAFAYQYRINSSNADYFDYTNHSMSILLTRHIFLSSPLQLMYRFERRTYPRQVEGTIRRDNRHTILLSLTTPLTPWMALRTSYAFQMNNSNVRDYRVRLGTVNLVFSWGGVKPNTKPKKNIQSPDETTYYKLGIYYTKKGDLDKAVAAFGKSIALNPKNAKAYSNLGFVYIAQKDFERALAACRQAVELDPNLTEAHINLGIAYYKKGRLQECLQQWRESLKLDPNNAKVKKLLDKLGKDKGGRG